MCCYFCTFTGVNVTWEQCLGCFGLGHERLVRIYEIALIKDAFKASRSVRMAERFRAVWYILRMVLPGSHQEIENKKLLVQRCLDFIHEQWGRI